MKEHMHPQIKGRRRFFEEVAVREVEPDGFEITLDGRALKTPNRNALIFQSQRLARAVALEWDHQGVETGLGMESGIEPASMPLMSLTATWMDVTTANMDVTTANVLRYLQTDSACYFAEKQMRILVGRQREHFLPLHDWLREDFNIELATTDTLNKLPHPPASIARMVTLVEALDPAALTALQCATMEAKSLVMGLAVVLGRMTPKEAEVASRLEEEFQMEQWGLVEGGHDLDIAANKVSLNSAAVFLHLLDGEEGRLRRIEHLQKTLAALDF